MLKLPVSEMREIWSFLLAQYQELTIKPIIQKIQIFIEVGKLMEIVNVIIYRLEKHS